MNEITATLLRRKLHDSLKTVEEGKGTVRITRHGKTVAALVSASDLALIEAMNEQRKQIEGLKAAVVVSGVKSHEPILVVPEKPLNPVASEPAKILTEI